MEIATEAWQVAHRLAGTEFVPVALRGKPEAVLACIMSGHELGIGPMQALQKIHVIDGRPALAAELMRALVLAQGHELYFDGLSSSKVTIVGRRNGQTRETRLEVTLDDFRVSGITDKKVWRSYPMAMLMARATGILCRAMFADVLAGFSYTSEEVSEGAYIDVEDLTASGSSAGTAAGAAPAEGRATRGTKRTRSRAESAPAAPPTPAPTPPLPGEEEDDESDIIDAEIVEPGDEAQIATDRGPREAVADDGPSSAVSSAEMFPDDSEPPVEAGGRLEPHQALAMRFAELGVTDRATRLDIISGIVGRPVTTSKVGAEGGLELEEVRRVFDALADDTKIDSTGDPDAPGAETGSEAPPPTAGSESERAPSARPVDRPDPATMDGDAWRAVLQRRGVKAAELLKKARELAGTGVGTLDDIAGTGVGLDLMDFVEDLALSRGK